MAYDDDIISTLRLKAVDETGDVLRGMSKKIEETTRAFEKLTGGFVGGEIARRSFEGYAELTRNLEKLQFAAKLTGKDMESLGKTFDEIGKMTGRSTDEIVKSFQNFYAMSGQQFAPGLEKMFKTIAEASQITNVSMDQLSRMAAAAMNNLKVPLDQMDGLVEKWSVELPASLEAFSQVAPRVTESLNTIGFSGSKNAEEVALIFAAMNRGLGNTRLSAQAMNEILAKMTDGSSQVGQMMIPTLMNIRQHGGSVVETFEAMYKALDDMHAFDKDVPINYIEKLGINLDTLRGIKTFHDSVNGIVKTLSEGEQAAKKFSDEVKKVSDDPLAAINQLGAGLENVRNSIGALLVSLGANENLKAFADQMMSIARVLDDLNKGEWKKAFQEAVRPPGGEIPGEEHEHGHETPHASANPWSTWEGNALTRPGIAMYNAWRGLTGGISPPKMAAGGIVTKPTLAEIGEGGHPEAVIPLDGKNLGSKDAVEAVKENTEAINRMTSFMRSTSHSGIFMNAAFTPGAGDNPTPAEAGLYGGGSTGPYQGYGAGGGSGYSGGGGSSTPTFRPGVGHGGGRRGGIPSDADLDAKDRAWWGSGGGHRSPGGEPHDTSPLPEAGQADLANDRHKYDAELEAKPWLADRIAQISLGENRGPIANQKVIETIFNRASARKTSLEAATQEYTGKGSRGYYPASTFSGGSQGLRNPKLAAMAYEHLRRARGGSNVSDYATDNSSGNFAYRERRSGAFTPHGPEGDPADNGESFFSPGTAGGGAASRASYENWRRSLVGGHGPAVASGPRSSSGSSDRDPTGAGASFEHYQQLREHLERPIKMQIEAPTIPSQQNYRQRMSRQISRYQSDDQLQSSRYASQMDIGFA